MSLWAVEQTGSQLALCLVRLHRGVLEDAPPVGRSPVAREVPAAWPVGAGWHGGGGSTNPLGQGLICSLRVQHSFPLTESLGCHPLVKVLMRGDWKHLWLQGKLGFG